MIIGKEQFENQRQQNVLEEQTVHKLVYVWCSNKTTS